MNRGRFVVASENVIPGAHGRELAATHAFFGATEAEARARFAAYRARREAPTLGDPAPLVWQEEPARDGGFPVATGGRYAVLASVSRNVSLDAVARYLAGHGWQMTYAWEQDTPTRDLYAVDAWLASLAADPTDHHRWIYGEADRTGASDTLGVRAPWPLTIYQIAHVFRAVPAPPGSASPAAPTLPPPTMAPPPPAGVPTAVYVVGGGIAAGALAWAIWRWLL